MLFLRALLAFLALPAVVGGLIPWWWLQSDTTRAGGTVFGWPVLTFGLIVVLLCVRDFYRIGKGTLAPWDPPKRLVVIGLYRFTRNPMYIGLLSWVAGWSLLSGSTRLAVYTIFLVAAFHLRVVLYEEPTLARLFVDEWPEYRSTVNRWLPKPFGRNLPPCK